MRRAVRIVGTLAIAAVSVEAVARQSALTLGHVLEGATDFGNLPGSLLQSPVPEPEPGRRFALVHQHVNPSAAWLFVISRDFKLVRELHGWALASMPDESIVYHRNQVHFAPIHSLEVAVFDPVSGTDAVVYPPESMSPLRQRFIERVAAAYRQRGEDWFRIRNHHMDPTRFDSSLKGPVTVDAKDGTMTFLVEFREPGDGATDPGFSDLIRVACAPLAPAARMTCHEARAGRPEDR
jgi:hypothetical protein